MSGSRLVRYCPECGWIGDVPTGPNVRDCCPDGAHAEYVGRALAVQAWKGFHTELAYADTVAAVVRGGPAVVVQGEVAP